jgi:hypothetical protein
MRRRSRQREEWAKFIRGRRGTDSQAAFGNAIGFTGSLVSSWEVYGTVPLERTVREAAQAIGDDLGPWLAAAGYTEPAAVAEPAAAYGAESTGDAGISEYIVRVDYRARRVTIHQAEGGRAPRPAPGGKSERPKLPRREDRA